MTKKDDSVSFAMGCGFLMAVLLICLGLSALSGFVTMLVLGAMGIHYGFWLCWGIWILLSALFEGNRRR